MIVVIRRDIGNFPDVVGGVAHGHTQTRRFDHRAVIAGVAHGHRLRAGQAQVCRQRQQTAARRPAAGVALHVAGQAASMERQAASRSASSW